MDTNALKETTNVQTVAEKRISGQKMRKTMAQFGKATVQSGIRVAQMELPSSLKWIFALGFKIGVVLVIKSGLILWDYLLDLTWFGGMTILSQLVMGMVLIAYGAVLQTDDIHTKPAKIRECVMAYFTAASFSTVVNLSGKLKSFAFFKNIEEINWFMNVLNNTLKGMKEIGLSAMFADRVLWMLLCWTLFAITGVYYRSIKNNERPIKTIISDEPEIRMIEGKA